MVAPLLSTLLIFTALQSQCQAQDRSHVVSIDASWFRNIWGPIAESIEIIHDEATFSSDPWQFWRYIEYVSSDEELRQLSSCNAIQSKSAFYFQDKARKLIESYRKDLVKIADFSLSHNVKSIATEASSRISLELLKQSLGNEYSKDAHMSDYLAFAIVFPGNSLVHSVEELRSVLDELHEKKVTGNNWRSTVFEELSIFDRIFPSKARNHILVLLNGVVGSAKFKNLHDFLVGETNNGRLIYALHQFLPPCGHLFVEKSNPLNGWGVSLDIKNVEYENFDDGELKYSENSDYTDAVCQLRTLADILEGVDDREMKTISIYNLGFQSLQQILQSSNPIDELQTISHNFPKLMQQLSSNTVDKTLKNEMKNFSECLRFTDLRPNTLFINGMPALFQGSTFDFFEIFERFQKERADLRILHCLYTESSFSIDFNQLHALVNQYRPPSKDIRIDIIGSKKNLRKGTLLLSDIENENNYRHWQDSLLPLLRPLLQPPLVRRNIITIIFVADIDTVEGLNGIYIASALSLQAPVRVGIVVKSDPSMRAEATKNQKDKLITGNQLIPLVASIKDLSIRRLFVFETFAALLDGTLDESAVTQIYVSSHQHVSGKEHPSDLEGKVFSILRERSEESKSPSILSQMNDAIARSGLAPNCYLINGKLYDSLEEIQETLLNEMMSEYAMIADLVREGFIHPSTKNVYAMLLQSPGLTFIQRFHPSFLESNRLILKLYSSGFTQWINSLDWVAENEEEKIFEVSLIVIIGQNDISYGLVLLREALQYINVTDGKSRLSVICHDELVDCPWEAIKDIMNLSKYRGDSLEKVYSILADAVGTLSAKVNEPFSVASELQKVIVEFSEIHSQPKESKRAKSNKYTLTMEEKEALGINFNESALYINGEKFVSSETVAVVTAADVATMAEVEEKFAQSVMDSMVPASDGGNRQKSNSLLRVLTFAKTHFSESRVDAQSELVKCAEGHAITSGVARMPANDDAGYQMQAVAVVDPLSSAAQRMAPVLQLLHTRLGCSITLILLPALKVTSVPLQNFYRFSVDGGSVEFTDLPRNLVLTQRLDLPSLWLVKPMETSALLDLDNLHCTDGGACSADGTDTTFARYALSQLLVTGACHLYEGNVPKGPASGLQLQLVPYLGTEPLSDTVVMNNFSYFQLKATPGLWYLKISPDSEYEERLELALVAQKIVAVNSLTIKPIVVHAREKKSVKAEIIGSFASFLSRTFSSLLQSVRSAWTSPYAPVAPDKEELIHVFSLASGRLYERFLKVMMLSSVRQSKARVKFWLLENFLTASLKSDLSALAERYGFDFAYVTYQWPEWLPAQTDQQRKIWGFKILFLDVMFPLNVKKIIYIDADQVVQSDLSELWSIDLNGRVYGFTPFCDSRDDMLEYQFWRGGFWRSHLRELPYHISALFVVDLERFRSSGAGDILRGLYMSLSRDPNSLANLDQDLPNYAQHIIPIYTLPSEWLWCDTWCSEATKSAAKTIDLCNNPKHKEPKLKMAGRVISGPDVRVSWAELDSEIRSVLQKPDNSHKSK